MKIISDMILCIFLNYHIICVFSAAQIRFPAKSESKDMNRRDI